MDEILEQAARLAESFEGLSLKPYHDPVGFPTIGFGHLLSRTAWEALGKYPEITNEEAHNLLKADLVKAANAAVRLCPGATTVNQLAALTDFAFNCGAGNLQMSALRSKINRADVEGAAAEFSRWIYARGVKLPGLMRRRKAECALFLS